MVLKAVVLARRHAMGPRNKIPPEAGAPGISTVETACTPPLWLGPDCCACTVGGAGPQHSWLRGLAAAAAGVLVGGVSPWCGWLQNVAAAVAGMLVVRLASSFLGCETVWRGTGPR